MGKKKQKTAFGLLVAEFTGKSGMTMKELAAAAGLNTDRLIYAASTTGSGSRPGTKAKEAVESYIANWHKEKEQGT